MDNLADCLILLLVIFLTKFTNAFAGRWAQAGHWNGNIALATGTLAHFVLSFRPSPCLFPGWEGGGGHTINTLPADRPTHYRHVGQHTTDTSVVCQPTHWLTCWRMRRWDRILNFYPLVNVKPTCWPMRWWDQILNFY